MEERDRVPPAGNKDCSKVEKEEMVKVCVCVAGLYGYTYKMP